MRVLLAIVVVVSGACRGGSCGAFEVYNTAEDVEGRETTGRYVRSCSQDGVGSWDEDNSVSFELPLVPVRAEQTQDWRLRVTMPQQDLREGRRLQVGRQLWGRIEGEGTPALDLTDGYVEILDIGRMGDPCLARAELPIRARYALTFGAEPGGDGPGAVASGRDRFGVALGSWACP